MSDFSAVSPARSRINTKTIVSLAMLAALAYVVMLVCKVIPPVAGILSFDLKDTIITIGGFIFGPAAAVIVTVTVAFLEFITVSDTGPIGLLMNVLATLSFVCPAVLLYRRRHKLSGAVMGLITGVLVLTGVMILWNYLITPVYLNVDRETVVGMIVPILLPFNLVKGILNAALIMLLYKPVVGALRKAHLVPQHQHQPGESDSGRRFQWGPTLIAALVLITAILLALVLIGII